MTRCGGYGTLDLQWGLGSARWENINHPLWKHCDISTDPCSYCVTLRPDRGGGDALISTLPDVDRHSSRYRSASVPSGYRIKGFIKTPIVRISFCPRLWYLSMVKEGLTTSEDLGMPLRNLP